MLLVRDASPSVSHLLLQLRKPPETMSVVQSTYGYGHIKLLVIYESQSGLTMAQIAKKHGLRYDSVRIINKTLSLNIPHTRRKLLK